MRKAQKQEILEMIQTLYQAHDEIKRHIESKKHTLAQDMLTQCQECAISMGTAIEKLEGEGFITVSYIEAYCDMLFSVYEELHGSEANANKIHKNLRKQLLRIENSVKNDIPVRREIAFFPYKASMWDSLESVYLTVKEDPDCDVYCVPIPYYDRKPDRSLGELHYEGREYPRNIEIIDWQTYNFEERKPDAIYIHNPYDDYNLVTCVHPRFFASNLKKYTEELVYIPYFVLNEIEPNDQQAIDSMKHFCFLPGVFYADKVIVQSEKMKEIYINEYIKAAKEQGIPGKHTDRKYLEEKILGLGSPKFDKVQNTKKEDLDIPEEWLKIIKKPDGSWKKIIFYNTSIAALLRHNEKMLEKMKYVFKIFEENKDEVALLWRPHPLIRTTVESMRPRLWTEYDKLVQQYKAEGWGIYDDTADVNRAIALSDAYYGDGSSVVQLYEETGKPVLIQHPYADGEKEMWTYLPFVGGVIKDEKIWCVNYNENALYTIDTTTGQIDYVDLLKEKNEACFRNICRFEDRLLLIPSNGIEVGEYHTETGEKGYYLYDEKRSGSNGQHAAIVWDKYLYVFPREERYVFRLDIRSGEKRIIEVPKKLAEDKEVALGEYCAMIDNKAIVPCENDNGVIVFDLKTEEFVLKKWEEAQSGFEYVVQYGQCVYLVDREKNIYRIQNSLEGELEKILSLQGEYRDIKVCDSKLIFISEKGISPQDVIVVDLLTKMPYMLDELPKTREEGAIPHFSYIVVEEEKCFIIPTFGREMVIYNVKTGAIENKTWYLSKKTQEHIEMLTWDRLQKEEILKEDFLPIETFLKSVLIKY